jgi:hypothetical protein
MEEDTIKFRTKANKDGTRGLQYTCLKLKIRVDWDKNGKETREIVGFVWSDWQDFPSVI